VKQGLHVFLVSALLGYGALCAVMFAFQRSLMYLPQPRAVTAPESTMGLRVDGAELVVTVRPHAGRKAIVYFGGNAEDVSRQLADFSDLFPEHALFLLHYRGYGGSTGSPTEQAMHGDAAALFQRVHAQHPETVIFGRSLGTGLAVRLASRSPAARLILVTPFDSATDIARHAYPFLPVRLLLLDTYDSGTHAPRIRVPTTIIRAEHDEVVPRTSTERLFGRFQAGVATMTVIAGVGHNDLGLSSSYRRALQAALP
jgi:uncharacterized protein